MGGGAARRLRAAFSPAAGGALPPPVAAVPPSPRRCSAVRRGRLGRPPLTRAPPTRLRPALSLRLRGSTVVAPPAARPCSAPSPRASLAPAAAASGRGGRGAKVCESRRQRRTVRATPATTPGRVVVADRIRSRRLLQIGAAPGHARRAGCRRRRRRRRRRAALTVVQHAAERARLADAQLVRGELGVGETGPRAGRGRVGQEGALQCGHPSKGSSRPLSSASFFSALACRATMRLHRSACFCALLDLGDGDRRLLRPFARPRRRSSPRRPPSPRRARRSRPWRSTAARDRLELLLQRGARSERRLQGGLRPRGARRSGRACLGPRSASPRVVQLPAST